MVSVAEEAASRTLDPDERSSNLEAQAEEHMALEAIYGDELEAITMPPEDVHDARSSTMCVFELRVAVELPGTLAVEVPPLPPLDAALRAAGLKTDRLADNRCLQLSGLPPICLRFRFPPSYPSRSPPEWALRCSWLSDDQLAQLAGGLDEQWTEGCPVISLWTEWLRSSALETLPVDLLAPLRLPSPHEPPRLAAARAYRYPRSAAAVLLEIAKHSELELEGAWQGSLHACGICLEEHVSLDCVRFVRCRHTFCKACVSGYFESQLGEGAATSLFCPEPSCRTAATPPEVRQLLPPGLYERYERQLLQASLDEMKDVVWCPRCQYPALLQEGDNGRLALCGECGFSFCTECRKGWHGLAPCANLAQRWRDADEEGREALRKKYGDKVMEEVQSSEWMSENTKPCPRCSTAVEKNGGCNHITCKSCSFEWCWLCMAKYSPGHFRNGDCEQFSQDFFDELNLTREEFDANYVVLNHW